MCLPDIESEDQPKCKAQTCEKIHPQTGWKLCSKPNWPSRAFRAPDQKDHPSIRIWFAKNHKALV